MNTRRPRNHSLVGGMAIEHGECLVVPSTKANDPFKKCVQTKGFGVRSHDASLILAFNPLIFSTIFSYPLLISDALVMMVCPSATNPAKSNAAPPRTARGVTSEPTSRRRPWTIRLLSCTCDTHDFSCFCHVCGCIWKRESQRIGDCLSERRL